MNVIFVDDEIQVLKGLERMLDAAEVDWNCQFVSSGPDALATLENEAIDVMVSDMQMPGMDGAELLSKVATDYPEVVRIVLSGQADRGSVFRAVRPMHQYLSKPADSRELIATIERARAIHQILESESLAKLIGGVDSLPSLPETYQNLMDEIDSEEPSLESLGEILSKDPAMTAKILQIVNSAIFGLRNRITCPKQAISLLGINTIKSLALTIGIFQKYDDLTLAQFSVSAMMQHCLEVGVLAQQITQMETASIEKSAEAFTAGILHDIGKLLLLSFDQELFVKGIKLADEENITLVEAEKTIWSADHAAVGAYLLTIWGLPQSVVEVVCLHHSPLQSRDTEFSILTAVCAANDLSRNEPTISDANDEYFKSVGCTEKFDSWSDRFLNLVQD